MRLKTLVLENYKSVKRTERLLVDDRITILIGANDNGKTNLLNAMECLNDDNQIRSNDINWDAGDDAIATIKWHFAISDDSQSDLERIKDLPLDSPSSSAGEVEVEDSVEEEAVEESDSDNDSQEEVAPENSGEPDDNADAKPSHDLADAPTFPLNSDGEIVFIRDSKTNTVRVESLPIAVPLAFESHVLELRPRIEIFQSPTSNLIDQVNLAQLETEEFEFMQGIFRLAGIWDRRSEVFVQNDMTSRILDEASRHLTDVLNDTWNQGKDLKWKLEHTGTNGDHIVIKIEDPAILGRYTRPSLRSSGFRTYFLLSMITLARTQNQPSNSYLYLFDEPGTYLHPHAQLDLQRSFENIAEQTQILYTTHSLFLVSKNYPGRNRVVTKTKFGTKIDQKPFVKNWKSVRESLGILLSNNFLIADKSLLVEGPSDVVYVYSAIRDMKRLGKIDIDLNDLSIVDAGNHENYVAMAKVLLSEGRQIVALVDGDSGGERIEEELKKVCEQELSQDKLKILVLPRDKSSEDVFANLSSLKEAIAQVCSNLVALGVRVAKEGMNVQDRIAKIASAKGATLGRRIREESENWFEGEDEVSKLSIALQYETIRQESAGTNAPDQLKLGLEQVEKIKNLMNLRGEKAKELGVFDESDA